MLTQEQQGLGTGFHSNVRTYIEDIDGNTANSIIENQDQDTYNDWRQDYVACGSTVPGCTTDYSPTGAPAFAVVEGIGGWAKVTLAADNAAMIAGFSSDDYLWLPTDRYMVKGSRVYFADALVANEYALLGVSAELETGVNPGTLAGFIGAAFYLDGDMSLHVKIEDDNGVSVDEDLGITVDTDTAFWYRVERNSMGAWQFYWGPEYGVDGDLVYENTEASFDATQLLQPIDVIGKSTGVTQPVLYIDCQRGRLHRGDPNL